MVASLREWRRSKAARRGYDTLPWKLLAGSFVMAK